MKQLDTLKKEATQAAVYRGHVLGDWIAGEFSPKTTAHADCKYCGRGAFVDSKPAPNGIDISGEAVALNCNFKRRPKGLFPGEYTILSSIQHGKKRTNMYRATGEFRAPRAGEYFLSGAIIQAYLAVHELGTKHWIAEPVIVAPPEVVLAEVAKALNDLYEVFQWLQDTDQIKSPIEPHPYGLGVLMAKQAARTAMAKAKVTLNQ